MAAYIGAFDNDKLWKIIEIYSNNFWNYDNKILYSATSTI